MKVWITRYVLSKGILEVDAEVCIGDMIKTHEKWPRYFHGIGQDYYREKQSAVKCAKKKLLPLKSRSRGWKS